jgi:hypothetical protein
VTAAQLPVNPFLWHWQCAPDRVDQRDCVTVARSRCSASDCLGVVFRQSLPPTHWPLSYPIPPTLYTMQGWCAWATSWVKCNIVFCLLSLGAVVSLLVEVCLSRNMWFVVSLLEALTYPVLMNWLWTSGEWGSREVCDGSRFSSQRILREIPQAAIVAFQCSTVLHSMTSASVVLCFLPTTLPFLSAALHPCDVPWRPVVWRPYDHNWFVVVNTMLHVVNTTSVLSTSWTSLRTFTTLALVFSKGVMCHVLIVNVERWVMARAPTSSSSRFCSSRVSVGCQVGDKRGVPVWCQPCHVVCDSEG